MESYIDIDSYHLFVRQVHRNADAPTLVFLHDAWGCTALWGDFPQRLADGLSANYLVYDRAGHGRSGRVDYYQRPPTFFDDEARILTTLMDKTGIRKAILCGHSDGTTIALKAAAAFPERISGLILQSPHSCAEPEGLAMINTITENAQHTHLHQKLAKYHGENMPNVFNYWRRMWVDEHFRTWNIAPAIRQINCPIVAFRGENDRLDTVKQLANIADNARGPVVTAQIPNAAHSAHKENKEATLQFILTNKQLFMPAERE